MPSSIKQYALEKKVQGWSDEKIVRECMKDLGVKDGSVKDQLRDLRTQSNVISKHLDELEQNQDGPIGMSLEDVRAKLDPVYKIKMAIKNIPTGRYIPENEFRDKMVKCNTNQFRTAANLQQFDIYHGKSQGMVLWGASTGIKQLRDEGILI